jgi:hypothetical protein
VKDLAPVEDLPLEYLDCSMMQAPDLTPVRKTPIKELRCDHPEQLVEALSRLPTLEKVNGEGMYAFYQKHSPARAELMDWIAQTRALPVEQQVEAFKVQMKQHNPDLDVARVGVGVAGGRVTSLTLPASSVMDLSPLRALPDLRFLHCMGRANAQSKVSDLTPLAYLTHLETVDVSWTSVADLTPLKSLPLVSFQCDGTSVRDLRPLRKVPLQSLYLDPAVARANRKLLDTFTALRTINGKRVDLFW